MPSFSFTIAPVFISGSRTNSICLPILIWKQDAEIVGANALIDSGAMECFISKDTVQRLGLPIQKLDQMVQAWNVDGTPNKSGSVKYKTNIVLDYGGVREHQDLFILNCGKDEVILGLLWLWAINPEINWQNGRITITPSNYRWTTGEPPGALEQLYLLWYMLHNEAAHIEDELYDTFKSWMLEQQAKFFNASSYILEFIIKWTTISIIIAQGATKEEVTFSTAFKEYEDVFSEKSPQNCHPLGHMTMPSNSRTRLYPSGPKSTCLIPLNTKLAKSSLKNISKQKKSPPWNLPKPRHSSLSKRKRLGSYTPAKTISTSIATPSRTPTLFPSSPTLSTNYEDHWVSPNSTYDGDIITSSSNPRIDGRPPSLPHWGYSNWTSCSLECATHQPLSKHSWMISLETISQRAG